MGTVDDTNTDVRNRVEMRMGRFGTSACIALRRECSATGQPIDLCIWAFGADEDATRAAVGKRLHTPTCDAFARQLGDSLDSRAFGAYVEHHCTHPLTPVTEMQVLARLRKIEPVARRLRSAFRAAGDAELLDVIYAPRRAPDVAAFARVLDELCEMPDRLVALGWRPKTTRGPLPHADEWQYYVEAFAYGWRACIGTRVSYAERSKYMRAALRLLPECCDADVTQGRVMRATQRYLRGLRKPLPKIA